MTDDRRLPATDELGAVFGWLLLAFILTALGLFLGAAVALVGRVIYWLRYDDWLTSACEIGWVSVANPFIETEKAGWDYISVFCFKFDTGWRGFDRLLNWILSLDVSVVLVLSAFTVLIIGMIVLTILGKISKAATSTR